MFKPRQGLSQDLELQVLAHKGLQLFFKELLQYDKNVLLTLKMVVANMANTKNDAKNLKIC